MQAEASLTQAREWLSQGLFSEAFEMLLSLRREFEATPPAAPLLLDMWRGLLTLAQARSDARLVQEVVPKLLQAGREQFEFDSSQMGALLHHAGQALAAIGAGSDAETFFMQAFRRLPEEKKPRYDYGLQLAYFYASYGHLDQALRWAKDAAGKSSNPEELMLAHRAICCFYDAQGKSLEAAGLRQQGQSSMPGLNPGWLLIDQARSQRRLGLASRADALYREGLGHLPDGDKARIYREIALNLLSRRDLAGAEAALLEGAQWVNPVSFEGQLLRAEQARLWQFQGRFAETEAVVQEILALWCERFAPHHPVCLRLREVLVELSILRRDWMQGIQRAQELLRVSAGAYGGEHPCVARALYWMGQVWLYEGAREQAKQAFTQAQMIWDEWADLAEVERALIHFGLGLIFADEMEFYKAEDEMKKSCDLIEQRGLGDQALVLGHLLSARGDICRITGRDRQAQECAQRSQELLRPKK
jgi:tetratricopeptide (TPR) repeat protein